MLYALGVFIVSAMLFILIQPKISPKSPLSPHFLRFGQYWAIDKLLRLIQFTAIGFSDYFGSEDGQEFMESSQQSLQPILEDLQNLIFTMRIARKVLRFVRGRIIKENILKHKFSLKFTSRQNLMKEMEQNFKFFANLVLIVFFFCDHFSFFNMIGILHDDDHANQIFKFGQKTLLLFHTLNFIRLFCLFQRHRSKLKSGKKEKQMKHGICDLIAHINDCTRITCVVFELANMQFIAVLAVASSMARLTKLFVT